MAETREHGTAAAGEGPLECVIVTPEATVLETRARFVALPLLDGEIGIARDHSPMIGRLGYGEMRVVINGRTECFYIDAGFVEVADNVVSVLTNRAVPAERIDPQLVAEQLATARVRPANTPELEAIKERIQLQARAQLRVARRIGRSAPHTAGREGGH